MGTAIVPVASVFALLPDSAAMSPLKVRVPLAIGAPAASVSRAVTVVDAPGFGTAGVADNVIADPVTVNVVCLTMLLTLVVIVTVRLDLSPPNEIVPENKPLASVTLPPGVKTVFAFVVTFTKAPGTILLPESTVRTVSLAVDAPEFCSVERSSSMMKSATFAVTGSVVLPAGIW